MTSNVFQHAGESLGVTEAIHLLVFGVCISCPCTAGDAQISVMALRKLIMYERPCRGF